MKTVDMDADPNAGFAAEFIAENVSQFKEFTSKRQHRLRVASLFRTFSERIAIARDELDCLRDQISFFKGANIPESIFVQVKNQHGGAANLGQIAANFASAEVLRIHGAALQKLADESVAKLEKEFTQFRTENQTILKELNLI